jgi:hypothetical protein
MPSRLLLLTCTSLLSGCAIFGISFDKKGADGAAGARYSGEECKAFEMHEDVDHVGDKRIVTYSSEQPARVDAVPLAVAKIACGDTVSSYPPDGGASAWVQRHHDFSPRRFDHVSAALMLTLCAKDSDCIGPDGPNSTSPIEGSQYAAGLMLRYAEGVEPESVDAALAEAGVSAALREHFLGDLARARADVEKIVAATPAGAAAVLVEIPKAVYAEHAARIAPHAELYARFDAAAAKARTQREAGVDDGAIAALEDLRGAWVAACGGLECTEQDLGVEIARELFFAHVTRQDRVGAQAELAMVAPKAPFELAYEIDLRQRDAMQKGNETLRKQEKLRDQGVDEGTARAATAGAAAFDFSKVHPIDLERVRTVEWNALVPGGGERRTHGGVLARKRNDKQTGLVVLEFADKVDRYADEDCRDTNRVERIESDGRLVYGQKCRATGKTNVYRTKIDPVMVPAREAKPLATGDDVSVVVGTGTPKNARVLSASRKDRLVQRRDVRVK